MNNLILKLKEKDGSVVIYAVAVSLSLLLLMTVISEYFRIKTITSHIEDLLQESVINLSIDNFENIYSSNREGHTSGYLYNDSKKAWEKAIDKGGIYKDISDVLGLLKNGGDYIKYSSNAVEYSISNLQVEIISPSLQSSSINKFIVESTLDVEIPHSFGWKLPSLKLKLKTNSEHMIMF